MLTQCIRFLLLLWLITTNFVAYNHMNSLPYRSILILQKKQSIQNEIKPYIEIVFCLEFTVKTFCYILFWYQPFQNHFFKNIGNKGGKMPLFLSYQIKFLKFTFPPVFCIAQFIFPHRFISEVLLSYFLFFSNLLIWWYKYTWKLLQLNYSEQ